MRFAAALLAAALSACGGGSSGAPPVAATPTPVSPPVYTTTAIANTSGFRMTPIAGDRLAMAVAADGRIAFASTFIFGVLVVNGPLSTFTGSLLRSAPADGPITYGRGADGDLYSAWTNGSAPPTVFKESSGAKWTLVPPRCGAGCDPVAQAWPLAILAGPDGATWVVVTGGLLRLNADGTTTGLAPAATQTVLWDAVVGPDNAFWAVDGLGAIERIPLSGAPAAFAVGGHPTRIAPGWDGTLWFLDLVNGVRRITTSGAVTTVVPPPSGSFSEGDAIAQGPDHALWFAEANANKLGRVSLSGALNEFSVPAAGDAPAGIAAAPDQSLYFMEQNRAGVLVVHAIVPQSFVSAGF